MWILTVGHSNRTIEAFLEMLRGHGVQEVVDVRTVPKSRYNPQFAREALAGSLAEEGIGYVHMPGLGGLRHPRPDSINTAWRNDSFRGYADHMQTAEFAENIGKLLERGAERQVVIMCAEAVPWRCHRSMIADALAARGIAVEHILTAARRDPHKVTPFARVEGERVMYPGIMAPG